MKTKPKILILCTGNSARSQMAEGLLRDAAGDRFEVFSAGTKPSIVRPEAIAAMAEIGIDISAHRSKSLDEYLGTEFAYIITVCDHAAEACPVFPGKATRLHWPFVDPEKTLPAFRIIRDQIREKVAQSAGDLVA